MSSAPKRTHKYAMGTRSRVMCNSIYSSASISRISRDAALSWPRIVGIANDFGIFQPNIDDLLHLAFRNVKGSTEENVRGMLREYIGEEMIELYKDDDGVAWCWLTGWYRCNSRSRPPKDWWGPCPPSWANLNPETGEPYRKKEEKPRMIEEPTKPVEVNEIVRKFVAGRKV